MSLNFVKSSILSSSDGIDFNQETLLDSEEAKKNRSNINKEYVKPLYLQLAERKAESEVSLFSILSSVSSISFFLYSSIHSLHSHLTILSQLSTFTFLSFSTYS